MALRTLPAWLAVAATVSAGPVSAERGTSSIWCGPVLAGHDFKSVEASWVIPNVSYPANADQTQQYFSSQWVGIDGTDGCKGLLQAGTSQGVSIHLFYLFKNEFSNLDHILQLDQGEVWHYSWVEFYPAETGEIDLDCK